MLDWIVDNGWTPHLIVDARSDAVTVPRQFVTEGYIRLNISANTSWPAGQISTFQVWNI